MPFAVCRLTIATGTGNRRLMSGLSQTSWLPFPDRTNQQPARIRSWRRSRSKLAGIHAAAMTGADATRSAITLSSITSPAPPVRFQRLYRERFREPEPLEAGRLRGQRELVVGAPPHSRLPIPFGANFECFWRGHQPLSTPPLRGSNDSRWSSTQPLLAAPRHPDISGTASSAVRLIGGGSDER